MGFMGFYRDSGASGFLRLPEIHRDSSLAGALTGHFRQSREYHSNPENAAHAQSSHLILAHATHPFGNDNPHLQSLKQSQRLLGFLFSNIEGLREYS